ncbi:MAG: hypothetical protein IPJ03_22220 [Ignavibacteriales bacterium]|nr:hypothetical protein [Ignavibacteriales bacterium]
MKKQDVKEIVLAHYPEIGDDKYVPKLPDISDRALVQMQVAIEFLHNNYPQAIDRYSEIDNFIDNIKDERAKR